MGTVPAAISRTRRSGLPSRKVTAPAALTIIAAHVAMKVRDHRQERADVTRDVERETVPSRIPAKERARENEVAGARDRQKLGQPLHHSEQRRVQ